MEHLCREYTLPRNERKTRAKGWILKNTRIGTVLDVKVCFHQYHYSIEILVESLFHDRTASWVRIVNGIEKYVTESTETINDEEHSASGSRARRRLKPAVTLSSVSACLHERKWTDINPEQYRHDCFLVSKAMTRLLRHDQNIALETDGAVKCEDFVVEFKK